jgi:hypothetical protein
MVSILQTSLERVVLFETSDLLSESHVNFLAVNASVRCSRPAEKRHIGCEWLGGWVVLVVGW